MNGAPSEPGGTGVIPPGPRSDLDDPDPAA